MLTCSRKSKGILIMKRSMRLSALLMCVAAGWACGLGSDAWAPSLSTLEQGMSRDADLASPSYPVCASTSEEVYQHDLALAGRLRGTFGEVGTLDEHVEEGLAGSASYPLEDRDEAAVRREVEEAIVQETQGTSRTVRRSAGGSNEVMEEAASAQASATAWLTREIIEETNRELNRIRQESPLSKPHQ